MTTADTSAWGEIGLVLLGGVVFEALFFVAWHRFKTWLDDYDDRMNP